MRKKALAAAVATLAVLATSTMTTVTYEERAVAATGLEARYAHATCNVYGMAEEPFVVAWLQRQYDVPREKAQVLVELAREAGC